MVLQYANEGTLRKYLKANFTLLQWTDKLCIAKGIALGLLHLHDNNIIHRDLHSNNILICQRQPKIADFGISKQINETSITSNSTVHGMPAYIEPQCLIEQGYKRDKRSDIYSFGVILWEISSGRSPFLSFESALQLAVHISRGNREEPVKGTPSQYIELYKQCWDNDPANRPETRLVLNTLKQLIPNSIKDLRKEAYEYFEQCKFLNALELCEEILKNDQHGSEDQKNASTWDLSSNKCGLENLNDSNGLGSKEGKVLADALCRLTTLASLDLCDNDLGPEGGKALADAL
ncbi:kinase-like protein [Gigaspora margarita]|nr:kinase-like protein [Gigaspora margarita]